MATQDPSLLPIIKVRNTGSVLFTLGVLCALLYLGRLLLVTLLVGIFITFILDPLVRFFMRLRLPRGFASFLVCGLALLVMYLGALLAFSQAQGLWDEMPSYTRRVNDLSDKVLMEVESAEKTINDIMAPKRVREMEALRLERERQLAEQQKQRRRRTTDPPMSPLLPPAVQEVRIRPERSPLVEYLYSNWQQFYDIALMVSFVPFLVYFMLAWRDHFVYNFLRVFEGESRLIASATMDGIARMTRAYVVGNFLLGMVLAVVSTGFFWMVKVPYWLLVGPLSGFLSGAVHRIAFGDSTAGVCRADRL